MIVVFVLVNMDCFQNEYVDIIVIVVKEKYVGLVLVYGVECGFLLVSIVWYLLVVGGYGSVCCDDIDCLEMCFVLLCFLELVFFVVQVVLIQ